MAIDSETTCTILDFACENIYSGPDTNMYSRTVKNESQNKEFTQCNALYITETACIHELYVTCISCKTVAMYSYSGLPGFPGQGDAGREYYLCTLKSSKTHN